MENEMKRSDECERFYNMINAYLDGELTEEEIAQAEAHLKACDSCREEVRLAKSMLEAMNGLDDDIQVPLKAQAAWRKAIRKEAASKKTKRWIRAVSSVAAAFIVLVASTVVLRETNALPGRTITGGLDTYAAVYDGSYSSGADIRIPPADNAAAIPMTIAYSEALFAKSMRQMPDEIIMETDGDIPIDQPAVLVDDAAYQESAENSASTVLIRSAKRICETTMFQEEIENLSELVVEYDGYITEEAIDYANVQKSAYFRISVPDDLLDDFMKALENIGTTVSVNRLTEDMSQYYYDAEARLISKRQIADRLNALISEADGEELSALSVQLEDCYNEIDEMERLLKTGSEIRYAQVEMTLMETGVKPVPTPEPSLSERSSSGFKQSMNAIGDFFEDMVVSMAIIAPVAIAAFVLAIIIGCIVVAVKKKNQKHSDNASGKEEI